MSPAEWCSTTALVSNRSADSVRIVESDADRVLGVLRGASIPLDDDVLARRLDVARQQVNQVCRRLAKKGQLRRYVGADGKIVNDATDVRVDLPPAHAAPAPSGGSVITEDEVKRAVSDHLIAQGFQVDVAWGRTRGIDIDARQDGRRVIVEAKGEVAAAGAQQVNYFLNALGELIQRMDDPNATYGLALPDHRQYRGLVLRLPAVARERLNLAIFWVRREGGTLAVSEDRAGSAPAAGNVPPRWN